MSFVEALTSNGSLEISSGCSNSFDTGCGVRPAFQKGYDYKDADTPKVLVKDATLW